MVKAILLDVRPPAGARRIYIPRVRGLPQGYEAVLARRMRLALANFIESVVEAAIRSTSLKSRSGRTFKQLRGGQKTTGGGRISRIRGVVRVDTSIAIHEFGGIITPTTSRVLTIPLKAALRVDGTPKRLSSRSWRSFGTFIKKINGKAFIVYSTGRRLVFLYILKDSVKMERRLFIRKESRARMSSLTNEWARLALSQMLTLNIEGIALAGVSTAKRPTLPGRRKFGLGGRKTGTVIPRAKEIGVTTI